MGIRKIGIVGCGTMGCQTAELFLSRGFYVMMVSRKKDAKDHCRKLFYDKKMAGRLKIEGSYASLSECDLLIESVKEDRAIKQEVFENLDRVASDHAIIASNSSTIPLHVIAANCKHKKNIIGFHLSNPATLMKVVEIPMLPETSRETKSAILSLARQIGKEPVLVKDEPGFLFNRIMFAMLNEAANTVYKGIATKEDVDRSMMLTANHPLGPITILDLVGIDVAFDILNSLFKQLNDYKYKPSPILSDLIRQNRLGRKTGKGFYDY
ncbi:3-hydroxyacyl-CoA dehydrogenase family protein [Candidatus Woesearchaeota archaeon]|nr:3-hydroxyacyl-CoA dehydrogenase family protein [Candidatus Woesearchaeota archaeon]